MDRTFQPGGATASSILRPWLFSQPPDHRGGRIRQLWRHRVSITGLHIPYGESPLAAVTVDERDVMSYYPFVQGGPAEGARLPIQGVDLMVYVNSRYAEFDVQTLNPRATALFEMAGVGMFGGWVKGDALAVLASPDGGSYERSVPPELLSVFLQTDSTG